MSFASLMHGQIKSKRFKKSQKVKLKEQMQPKYYHDFVQMEFLKVFYLHGTFCKKQSRKYVRPLYALFEMTSAVHMNRNATDGAKLGPMKRTIY